MKKPWTEEQFLDWADARGEPWEFDGFRPVAMAGCTARHGTVTANIAIALRRRLDGTAYSGHGPNLGIRTIHGRIRYPRSTSPHCPSSGKATGVFSLAYVILPFAERAPADAIRESLAPLRRAGRGDMPDDRLAFDDETSYLREAREAPFAFTGTGDGLQVKGWVAGIACHR